MKKWLGVMMVICAVLMHSMAADDVYERIRQQKEAVFQASLKSRSRASAAQSIVVANERNLSDNPQSTIPELTITEVKQRAGTQGPEAIVDVTYNLSNTELQCNIKAEVLTNDIVVVATPTIDQSGDYGSGVQPGTGRKFSWLAGRDWPNGYSDDFRIKLTATETVIPAEWATVTISWQNYQGGRDVDICAFWADNPGEKVGWHYISNSSGGYSTLKWPTGDNTGTGPEQVYCDAVEYCNATGNQNRMLHLHFNYFGNPGNSPNVDIIVRSGNREPLRELGLRAGTNAGSQATISDPGVVIKFDANNKPISININ